MRGVDAGLLPFSISQADFLAGCATVEESEVKRVAGLTDKQKRFVDEYLVDLNATQAAKRAGYKDPNIGRQLITKNNVAEEIRKRKKELSEKTGITQQMVVEELGKVAFAEAADYSDTKLKYANKLRALELLGKHLGLFEKDSADQEPEESGVILLGETDPEPEPPEVDDE